VLLQCAIVAPPGDVDMHWQYQAAGAARFAGRESRLPCPGMRVTLSFPRHPMPDRMRDSNPYRPPESRVAAPVDDDLDVVIAGQKLVILAAQVYFLSAAARMFIPVVGLIMLLVLNSRATRRLQAAGHHVGFLGG